MGTVAIASGLYREMERERVKSIVMSEFKEKGCWSQHSFTRASYAHLLPRLHSVTTS